MGIPTTGILAAEPAEIVILTENTTVASTGALAEVRTEILLTESAEDAEGLMRILTETSIVVLAWIRTEILLREPAEDADVLTGILTEITADCASVTPTAE